MWCEQMCWERGVSACWDTCFLLEESVHPLHSGNHQEWERAKSRCLVHLSELRFITLVSSKLENRKLQCLEHEPELKMDETKLKMNLINY